MTERDPVFVVGVGRSGTSLLQSMLAAHSEVAFLPETGFFRRYVATGRLARTWKRNGNEAVKKLLEMDRRLSRTKLSPKEIITAGARHGRVEDIDLYKAILQRFAMRSGGAIVGDKDPRLIEFLDLLYQEFPKSHIVHVIRDPRDVLASKKKAQWSCHRHWMRHVFAGRVQMAMGRREGRKRFGDRYHEVLYETLIADPDQVLQQLCVELGIKFESKMLEFSLAAQKLVSPDEVHWKRQTLGRLLEENSGKWRCELSTLETAVTESVCSLAMHAGEYRRSDAAFRLGIVARIELRCCIASIAIAAAVYERSRRIRTIVVGMVS